MAIMIALVTVCCLGVLLLGVVGLNAWTMSARNRRAREGLLKELHEMGTFAITNSGLPATQGNAEWYAQWEAANELDSEGIVTPRTKTRRIDGGIVTFFTYTLTKQGTEHVIERFGPLPEWPRPAAA